MNPSRHRRLVLKGLAATALWPHLPAVARDATPERSLRFYHTHTDERLAITYFDGGRYVDESLARLNHLLRDFRTGEIRPMAPELFDQLHAICKLCGAGTYEIISGYRSPNTNAMLRNRGGGVAKRSLHMDGRAIDVRLSGRSTAHLRDAAVALGRGGVGFYPNQNFVHLDNGRPRQWGPRA